MNSTNKTQEMHSLKNLYKTHVGKISDKWASYLEDYDSIFTNFRTRNVRILEIGIQNGGSLEIWAKYFPNAEKIVGCDINARCSDLTYDDPRISVTVGDANCEDVIRKITAISDYFDIIIDDGSHKSSDIIKSFSIYYQKIREGGIYIAEDLHCSYWGGFEGGMEAPYSSISFFKRLSDYVNREHWGTTIPVEDGLSYFSKFWGIDFDPTSLEQIDSVFFKNSICGITKCEAGKNQLRGRVIAGSVAIVEPAVIGLDGTSHSVPDQIWNAYGPATERSEIATASRDETKKLIEELLSARAKLVESSQQLSKLRELSWRHQSIEQIEHQLIMAQRRPYKLLANLIAFRVLRVLARSTPYLPLSMTKRFAKSAAKRDPNYIHAKGMDRHATRKVPVQSVQQKMLTEIEERFDRKSDKSSSKTGAVKFSILIPAYNTSAPLLRSCLDAIIGQTYQNWEVSAVNDASTSAHVQAILEEYSTGDSRIRVQCFSNNKGISIATQAALEASSGDYVCLVDHDDLLTFDALEKIELAIRAESSPDILYSDECKITPEGKPVEIYAKPDWSPALMINSMYIGHLTTYRRSLMQEIGGFRSAFDFSQDYDFALRASEVATKIHHIPEVLYGWRMIPESAAAGGKPYARTTNVAALQSAAERRDWNATAIAGDFANILHWEDMRKAPLVSIIIPSDNAAMINAAIDSIVDHSSYINYEILIVTNSAIISSHHQKQLSYTIKFVAYDKPFNFSDKCNTGADQATGEILIFYNDDVRVITPSWIERLIETFNLDGVGAVGPKLLYEDDTIQHAGMVTGVRRMVGTAFHTLPADSSAYFNFAQSLREVSLICGALIAIPARIFKLVGRFDSVNVPIYHSDVDLCLKVREAGFRCLYTPHATLRHIGHVSIGKIEKKIKKPNKDLAAIYMLKRWAPEISHDPYFPKPMRDLCYHDSVEYFAIHPGHRYGATSNGNILLVSHDLTRSGAPRVVVEMARALKSDGWFVVVAAPTDGPIREEFVELGITVVVDELLFSQSDSVLDFCKDYDLVIANTVVAWPLVAQLQGVLPVAWYIHETHLIDTLAKSSENCRNILRTAETVWGVSSFCIEILRKYRKTSLLMESGVEHAPTIVPTELKWPLRLAVFGSFEHRKGQDLLAEAYSRLSEAEQRSIHIYFYGRTLDQNLRDTVISKYGHIKGLHFEGELSHEDFVTEVSLCQMIVTPSRTDTLPLVSLYALSCGVPVMCTLETGTSAYLEDGISGYIIPSASASHVEGSLKRVIQEQEKWGDIGLKGLAIFDKHFSRAAFQQRLVEQCLYLIS